MTSKKNTTMNIAMIDNKFATVICIQSGTQIYVVEESVLYNNDLVRILRLYDSNKQYIKTIHSDAIEKFGMDNILLSIGNCYDYTAVISYCALINHIASHDYGFNKGDKEDD